RLQGLESMRCPECGLRFDPDQPATFTYLPIFVRWRFWMPLVLQTIVMALVMYALIVPTYGWGAAATLAVPVTAGMLLGYRISTANAAMIWVALSLLVLIGSLI